VVFEILKVGRKMPKKKCRGKAKVEKVMSEFKRRTLRSSSGHKVTTRAQAQAIAMSEAGLSRKQKKKPKRKKG